MLTIIVSFGLSCALDNYFICEWLVTVKQTTAVSEVRETTAVCCRYDL